MDVGAAFVADRQPPELADPRECSLYDPAVSPQALARIHPFAGDTAAHTPAAQVCSTSGDVVSLIGVHLLGPSPRSPRSLPTNRRNCLQKLALSSGARLQSIRPASCKRCSSSW